MTRHPTALRAVLRAAAAGLALAVGLALAAPSSGAAQAATPAVQDPEQVLTRQERAFLAEAVRDARRRTPFLASVVVVPRGQARAGRQLADEATRGSGVPVVLVVVDGEPPTVDVVTPDRAATEGYRQTIAEAQRRARAEGRDGGTAAAGLGFTAALVDGGADSGGSANWSAIINLIGLIGLVLLGLRSLLLRRRVKGVPAEAQAIGAVAEDVGLIHGRIEPGAWVSIGDSPHLVWYDREDSSTRTSYRIIRDPYGNEWTDSHNTTTDTHRERDGVPFVVSDGTGSAWVDPRGAVVQAKRVDWGMSFREGTSHWTEGIEADAEVTVGGPCRRDADGLLIFERRQGARTLVSLKAPAKARRAFRAPYFWGVVYTGLWVVIWIGLTLTVG